MKWYRVRTTYTVAFIREDAIVRIYPESNYLVTSDGTGFEILDDGINKILSDIKGNVKDFTE